MKKNKKGFTLVELLAVIVVLAIIMVIAIPSVMDSMNKARKNSFKIYAQKVLNTASTQYQTDMLTSGSATKTCYPISTLMKQGAGNYVGYVMVSGSNSDNVEFTIVIADGNYYTAASGTGASTKGATYAGLEGSAIQTGDAKTPASGITKITSTCPQGTTS